MGDKSIEKIEPKFDPRYDGINSKFETFGRGINNSNNTSNNPLRAKSPSFLSKTNIRNSIIDDDNNFESLLNKK